MKLTDVAWLAGVVDGEGCLSLRRSGGHSRAAFGAGLYLDNSSLALIERAEAIIRGLGVEPCRLTTRPGNRSPLARLPIERLYVQRGLSVVLKALIPFLVTDKRPFAEALLSLIVRPRPHTAWSEQEVANAHAIRARFMAHAGRTKTPGALKAGN